MTVVEARHRPSAGHLEANALAGLGQLSLYESDSADECSCTPDPGDIDHNDVTQNINTIRNKDIPMEMLSTSHAISQLGSSSILDSEGYLKLRVSSDVLDSKLQQANDMLEKISPSPNTMDICHMTREECMPKLSTFEDFSPIATIQTTTEKT